MSLLVKGTEVRNNLYRHLDDINKTPLVSKDEIHKFGRTYHFNALVLNKTGLKNLFTIISLANTT